MTERCGFQTWFVRLSTGAPAALYEPQRPRDRSRVAFIFMHPDANFISHLGCRELASRGHRVLGANTRFANMPGPTGGPYVFYDVLPDAAAAVNYLRGLDGIDTIVLAGHSGGGPLFSAYQNLAENGARALQGEQLFVKGPDALDGLHPADALVLLDAHLGYGAHALFTLDPSIIDEEHPSRREPSLDMFDPENGYDPEGASYPREFVQRYLEAQARRMASLVARAQERIAAIDAGRGEYLDDEPLVIPGIGQRLFSPDTSLLSHTAREWKLLRSDGSAPVGIVRSVRPPAGRLRDQRSYDGALVTSMRRFLATHAIAASPDYDMGADYLRGIDWATSATSAPASLAGVSVPLLSLVMTAHYFLVPNEINFSHATSPDKEMAMVEGATHLMVPCTAAEQEPGQFGDTVATTFDYVDRWVRDRF